MKNSPHFHLIRMFGVFACIAAAPWSYAEQISHSAFGNIDQWFINEPVVNRPLAFTDTEVGAFYEQIVLRAGDTLLVSAGGCVQTGGHGLTWKRYVDPQGPNSDRLYHGLIGLPGLPVMRIVDFFNQYQGRYTISTFPSDFTGALYLSYEDDGPSDNGYYSHDNGTGNQCLNVGNAWLNLTIVHP